MALRIAQGPRPVRRPPVRRRSTRPAQDQRASSPGRIATDSQSTRRRRPPTRDRILPRQSASQGRRRPSSKRCSALRPEPRRDGTGACTPRRSDSCPGRPRPFKAIRRKALRFMPGRRRSRLHRRPPRRSQHRIRDSSSRRIQRLPQIRLRATRTSDGASTSNSSSRSIRLTPSLRPGTSPRRRHPCLRQRTKCPPGSLKPATVRRSVPVGPPGMDKSRTRRRARRRPPDSLPTLR